LPKPQITKEQISMAEPTRTKLRITGLHFDIYDELAVMKKENIVRFMRPKDVGQETWDDPRQPNQF
jgi:hypothetical protein